MMIPSIDIAGGHAVQLRKGRETILDYGDPEALLRRFATCSEVAVVDIDAARGTGENEGLIRRLCSIASCRVGGGIRTIEKGRRLLRAGAHKIIIGTMAIPEFLRAFPTSKVLAAIDEDEGEIVDQGRQRKTGKKAIERALGLEPFVSGFVYTLVDREGTLLGADMERFRRFIDYAPRSVTVAGGITTAEEIVALDRLHADCQVGLAIHANGLDPATAFVRCIDFAKNDGIIPAVVRDIAGRVLMVGYVNEQALTITLQSGMATFWSRSRQELWRKGESSGNVLKIVTVRTDCDRDCLLVVSNPVGATCHLGSNSCFGDDLFDLLDLEAVLRERILVRREGSYTSRLASDSDLIFAKLTEECQEIVDAKGADEIVHEVADLLYHLLVFLAVKKVPLVRIISELDGRRTWDSPVSSINPKRHVTCE